jgi:mycoredoxin
MAEEETGMTQPVTMYTTTWCGFCRRLKSQLTREGVEINEIDIEQDPTAAEFVEAVNGGYQTVPTVVFPDGSALTNPSAAAVLSRLSELASR